MNKPEVIEYTTQLSPQPRKTWAIVIAFIALAPLNFILVFPVLGIFAAMVGLGFAIFGGFMAVAALFLYSVLPALLQLDSLSSAAAKLFFTMGTFALLAFSAGLLFVVARAFWITLNAYINSNLKLFKGLGDDHVQH